MLSPEAAPTEECPVCSGAAIGRQEVYTHPINKIQASATVYYCDCGMSWLPIEEEERIDRICGP